MLFAGQWRWGIAMLLLAIVMAAARVAEQNLRMGALNRQRFLKRDFKWCQKYNIPTDSKNFTKAHEFVKEQVSDETFLAMIQII